MLMVFDQFILEKLALYAVVSGEALKRSSLTETVYRRIPLYGRYRSELGAR